jgi:hypothetical protein
MYQEDYYNPIEPNDYDDVDKLFVKSKKMDKGYNVVNRMVKGKNGLLKQKKIDIYTCGDVGKRIRDAETGQYLNSSHHVGSKDEDLYFKVTLSTGECRNENGSNTLFYTSPQHYMNHLNTELSPDIITFWEEKRNMRLLEIKYSKRENNGPITVN